MRCLKFLVVATLSFGLSFAELQAQGFSGPSETPPASFKGKQYVDSQGCVYIRAGFGGQVRWVPRVTRSRKQVCTAGQTRSVKRTQTRKTQSRVVDPLAGAPIIGGPKAAKSKKTTRVVRQAQPTNRVVRRVKKSKTTKRVVRRGNNCGNASTFSSQFVNKGARCGPQNASPAQGIAPKTKNQRVGPKDAPRKIVEARTIKPPKGYKTAWKDGRLNPLSGVSTTSGKAQMQLVWSNTVPRRLIDPSTGKPASAKQKRLFGF